MNSEDSGTTRTGFDKAIRVGAPFRRDSILGIRLLNQRLAQIVSVQVDCGVIHAPVCANRRDHSNTVFVHDAIAQMYILLEECNKEIIAERFSLMYDPGFNKRNRPKECNYHIKYDNELSLGMLYGFRVDKTICRKKNLLEMRHKDYA